MCPFAVEAKKQATTKLELARIHRYFLTCHTKRAARPKNPRGIQNCHGIVVQLLLRPYTTWFSLCTAGRLRSSLGVITPESPESLPTAPDFDFNLCGMKRPNQPDIPPLVCFFDFVFVFVQLIRNKKIREGATEGDGEQPEGKRDPSREDKSHDNITWRRGGQHDKKKDGRQEEKEKSSSELQEST